MSRQAREIVSEDVPDATVEMIRNRVRAIVRHCCLYESNILDAVAMSCYHQGLIDGAQVCQQRPEVAALLWEPAEPPKAPR